MLHEKERSETSSSVPDTVVEYEELVELEAQDPMKSCANWIASLDSTAGIILFKVIY